MHCNREGGRVCAVLWFSYFSDMLPVFLLSGMGDAGSIPVCRRFRSRHSMHCACRQLRRFLPQVVGLLPFFWQLLLRLLLSVSVRPFGGFGCLLLYVPPFDG